MKSSPCSLQLEKARAQQQRPNAAINQSINQKKKRKRIEQYGPGYVHVFP